MKDGQGRRRGKRVEAAFGAVFVIYERVYLYRVSRSSNSFIGIKAPVVLGDESFFR